jgi:hypothetical protein
VRNEYQKYKQIFLGEYSAAGAKTENLAVCEGTVQKIWDSQHFSTLQASTACYGDSCIFLLKFNVHMMVNVEIIASGIQLLVVWQSESKVSKRL